MVTTTTDPNMIPMQSSTAVGDSTSDNSIPMQSSITDKPTVPLSEKVLDERSVKNHVALGENSPGPYELRKWEEMGLLDSKVGEIAYGQSVKDMQLRTSMITEMSQGAARQGRQLSDIEKETILTLSSADLQRMQRDPNTFLQEEYAKRVTNTAVARGVDNPLDWDPQSQELGYQIIDGMQNFVAKKEIATRLSQNASAQADQQSWIGWGVDVGKEFVAGYTWTKTKDAVEDYTGKNTPVTSLLPGSNLEEQISYLYSLPPKEMHATAKATIDGLMKDNPQLAARFASAITSYGSANVDNLLIAGTDLLTIGLLAPVKAAVRGLAGVGRMSASAAASAVATKVPTAVLDKGARLAEMLKPVAKAVTKREPTVAEVADAMGDVKESATQSTRAKVDEARQGMRGTDVKSMNQLDNEIVSTYRPQSILEGPTFALSREPAERVVQYMQRYADSALSKLYTDPLAVAKLGPQALKQATDEAFDLFSIQYRRLEDTVLDFDIRNVDGGGLTVRLGKNDATLFATKAQAEIVARDLYGLPEGSFTVGERLGGAFLEVFRPFDLTSKGVKNARRMDIKTDATPTSNNFIGQYLTQWRTGDDVLPDSVVRSFKRSIYGGSALLKNLLEQHKLMGKVKHPEDFMSFLKHQQTQINPTDPSKLGHFSKTIGEMEIEWAGRFNRLPTEAEVTAYFAYTSINNTHYAFLNMSYWLDKTSRGLMDNYISGLSKPVEGKVVKNIPSAKDEPATVLFFDESGKATIYNTKYNTKPFKGQTEKPQEIVDRLLKEKGFMITQISDTGQIALRDMPELADLAKTNKVGRINFVVSKQVDSKALSYQQIPYRPGGHHMMPEGFFVRQPQLYVNENGKGTYYGDTNIFHAPNEKAAQRMSESMDKARILLRDTFDAVGRKKKGVTDAQVQAFEAYVKANLPISPKDFKKQFTGKSAYLDMNNPIMYSISDANLDSAKDLKTLMGLKDYARGSDSQYNLYKGMPNMQYALQRGDQLQEAYLAGTKENPLLGIQPSTLLDPMAAMERSMGSMRGGRYLENLRFDTSERFLAEFSDLLDLSDKKFVNDPFLASTSAPFKEAKNLPRQDQMRLNQAIAYRDRFQQFLGFRTHADERVAYLADKVLAGQSPDLAQGWRSSMYNILSDPDPVSKFKNLAFHYKIGLFNPKHLLLQANSWAHTVGILGIKTGGQAGLTAMIQNIVMHSPDDLTEVGAKMISKLGWSSKDEFLEATRSLARSGYENVGKEVATREQHARARVVPTKAGEILEHGTWFFDKGESFMRRTSWNGAYLEWRRANPTAKMTDDVIDRLINRADLLNVNMSQASNAAWQQGFMSIPTQFMSYQIRLTEQLLSKRLTGAEKRRLFGTYAALYGVPVTTAVGSFGMLPAHNTIKEMALANQIDIEDNMILNAMNEGILGLLADGIFWEDVNFQERYGPYGSSIINDILSGDKTGFEMLMGASGSVLGEQMAAVAPVIPWLWRAVNPYADENPPLSLSDFSEVLRPITTFSATEKWIIAMKTGEYQTRKGFKVDEGNEGIHAFLYSYLGLQPQRIEDMYKLMGNRKDRQAFVQKMSEQISKDTEKMLNAKSQEDATYYHKRIIARQAMLEPAEQSTAIRRSLEGRRSLMESQVLYHRPKSAEEQDFNNSLYRKWMNRKD